MQEKYINYISNFKRLDISDKKEEIIKSLHELLSLLYSVNSKFDTNNTVLPILDSSESEEEYLDRVFTYIVSLKEENAKLIEHIIDNK